MAAVSKDVKKWLDAINKIRTKDFRSAPVTWSASFSTRCKQHADFLMANGLTGPEHEQRQDPQLPGSTHKGNMFAHMAMVSTNARNPKKLITANPGEAIPGHGTLGLSRQHLDDDKVAGIVPPESVTEAPVWLTPAGGER